MNCPKCFRFFCCCKVDSSETPTPRPSDIQLVELLSEDPFVFDNSISLEPFTSEALFLSARARTEQYEAALQSDGYIHVEKTKPNRGDNPREHDGWKIHISVNPTLDNLSKAWDLVMPILMRHGVYSFKVLSSTSNSQPGKEITVYAFDSRNNMPWQEILSEIHRSLENAHVEPNSAKGAPFVRVGQKILEITEPCICNSPYLYVRNDTKDEEYVRRNPNEIGPFFENVTFRSSVRPP